MKGFTEAPGIVTVCILLMVSSCRPDDAAPMRSSSAAAGAAAEAIVHRVANAAAGALDPAREVAWEDVQAQVLARIDSADQALRRVPALSAQERSFLRLDVSIVQLMRAHQFGIAPGANLNELLAQGRLVRVPENTTLWVLRDLHYSLPYLVPSAQAMLVEIGSRFQTQLDHLGVPRFRLEVTSLLRTPAAQATLRRRNSNAAPAESAHEFGTTIDIAYRKFAPPVEDGVVLDARARHLSDSLWTEMARRRGVELQAVLGRVLQDLRRESKLLTRMERRQPVYHTTVAAQYDQRSSK